MTELNGIVLSRLPVLPLRGLTAFPNMIVHFDVGRMMSIRALEAAMKNGQTIFLTAQRELKTDTPTPSDLYQIGTICQIRQILRLPGDNIRVLVEGKTRALAHNFIAAEKDEDCMYAEVEKLEDYVYGVTERRAQALVRTAQERFSEYAQYASRLSPDVELTVAEGGDPGYLADYIAQNIFEQEDDVWHRAQETHEERIYEPAQLTAMLEQAGFTEIKTYGDQSFAPVQGGEDRIYFTARKRD